MFSLRLARPYLQRHVNRRRLFSDVSLPIPNKPKGWPTPWITEDEATDFLFPLYSHGWYVATVRNDSVTRTAGLARRFPFPDFAPAAAFARDIFTLIEAENHHPCWLNMSHSTKGSILHICSTTHSALRPAWDPVDTPDSRALEGITLRDLRFAALISSLPTSPGAPSMEIEPSSSRPAWEELIATLQSWSIKPPSAAAAARPKKSRTQQKSETNTLTCAACAGPHATKACPTRHSLTPPPCSVCKGLHWRVDCPIRRQAQRSGSTVSQIRKTSMGSISSDTSYESPSEPCPNCGGAHWKADCREPQAPPELLQHLKLPVPKPDLY
ncbi:hypothetical protein DFH09DRAFT_1154507 [Mycena vulgaris]|nr:hypothetical protein DFH09DRAFT_1154507 [Mycena vulgaris]